MSRLKTALSKLKPHIKEVTLNSYLKTIQRLYRLVSGDQKGSTDNIWFLEENLFTILHSIPDRKHRTHLLAALLVFSMQGNDELYQRALKLYKSTNEQRITLTLTKAQVNGKNWINFPDIVELMEKLRPQARGLFSKSRWTATDLKHVHFFCYLAFVTEIPPWRLEYPTLEIVRNVPDRLGNFIVQKPNNVYFCVLKDFKTVRAHGFFKTDPLPPLLSFVCGRLIKRAKNSPIDGKRYLFQYRNGKAFSRTAFAKRMMNKFEEHTGKHITHTIVRKSFVTHYFPADLDRRMEVAQKMMHSVNVQDMHYRKRLVDEASSIFS
jgi:hypothetical protein